MSRTALLVTLFLALGLAPACDSGGGSTNDSNGYTVVPPNGDGDATDASGATDTIVTDATEPTVDAGPVEPDATPVQDIVPTSDATLADTSVDPEDVPVQVEDTTPTAEPSVFVGRWALRYWVNSLTEVPVLGGISATQVLSHQVVNITETDAGLNLEVETCDIEMIGEDGAMTETILPDAFVNSLPVINRSAVLTDDGEGFYAETIYEVRGAQLDDPANDPLPTDANDPKVVDQDQDGHPGMTISVTGFVDGDIYLVQRGWNALQTTSFDGERAFGVPDWGDEQTYLGASSFILEQISPSSWPDPDESKHGFELVYAPEITCNQVLSTAGAIFESQ